MTIRKWDIDASHSSVGFSARHMMMLKVHGRFGKFAGTIELDDADVTKSKVNVTIDTASIDTKDEKRDGHLKSADFFDVDKNAKIEFASTGVKQVSGNKLAVTGKLTLAGVTKDVTLDVEDMGRGKDPWGNDRAAFEAKTSILRSDYGLKWNQALETGGVLVSDKIEITLDVQAIPAKA